ncbi:18S rRNA maturation protein [Komagataella phaffii CBS 7435]|uniref:rRNA-processing protein EFG1 n=2 Tax=Komagataella phaffii TaxID=460519 RepID=C4QWL8_KOMPG|nr:uncharacterized protein PAS_chr1-1_0270 [Komagataella phaffii GS115]AOA60952.1 GQ67_02851T0 [Komagataella phaffii]CAH2446363.1 18S rRNA maturation protein [Komagataella phaffii CBS 7435]AOA65816.1 GQ68_02396T0 [Komagataella phaffii GS115]CAY67641.1 Protein of unknown function [Komagataella phaffii GS115]CCA36733.1 18S rRNA maturation protein [Komagataella phaffii CBS 7435]
MPKYPPRQSNSSSGVDVSGLIGAGSAKLKKKIRDIERLLRKQELPSDVRLENERALNALKMDLEDKKVDLRAQKYAKKYHMIRFFEKKKALRNYKRVKNELEAATDKKEIKKLKKKLHHCEIDLAYVVNFPKAEKYISLFPNPVDPNEKLSEETKKGLLHTEQERLAYKKLISEMAEAGTLPNTLEDILAGRPAVNVTTLSKTQNDESNPVTDDVSHHKTTTQAINNQGQQEEEFFE